MAYTECPNCGRSDDGASIYRCSECGEYGCRSNSLMGYGNTMGGCWTEQECPHCGEDDCKRYVGQISD